MCCFHHCQCHSCTVETAIFINQTGLLVTSVIDLTVEDSYINWQFLLQHNVQPKPEIFNSSKAVKVIFNTKRSSFEAKLVLTPHIDFHRIILNPTNFEPILNSLRPLADINFCNPYLPSVVIGQGLFQKIREPIPYLRNSKNLIIRKTVFGWILGGIVNQSDITSAPDLDKRVLKSNTLGFIFIHFRTKKFRDVFLGSLKKICIRVKRF